MRSLGWFVLGIVVTMAAFFVGAYTFLRSGGVPMETTASPLPLERTVARMALRASIGGARAEKDPLPFNETNMVAGARQYHDHCAVCHGLPGQQETTIAKGMFPDPPQLFEKREMVTDDPEGVTFWKVTHGIRLSGMPGFGKTLPDDARWQVTMLVAHADRLSSPVQAALTGKSGN